VLAQVPPTTGLPPNMAGSVAVGLNGSAFGTTGSTGSGSTAFGSGVGTPSGFGASIPNNFGAPGFATPGGVGSLGLSSTGGIGGSLFGVYPGSTSVGTFGLYPGSGSVQTFGVYPGFPTAGPAVVNNPNFQTGPTAVGGLGAGGVGPPASFTPYGGFGAAGAYTGGFSTGAAAGTGAPGGGGGAAPGGGVGSMGAGIPGLGLTMGATPAPFDAANAPNASSGMESNPANTTSAASSAGLANRGTPQATRTGSGDRETMTLGGLWDSGFSTPARIAENAYPVPSSNRNEPPRSVTTARAFGSDTTVTHGPGRDRPSESRRHKPIRWGYPG